MSDDADNQQGELLPGVPMFGKVFASLYQGTLRGQAHEILVFTNLIAHADREGYVDKHPRAIAEECGLSIEEVRAALGTLEAPDPESRSPDEGGRRIMRIDDHRAWGWRLVNHLKYREMRNEEVRREQNRSAQERARGKRRESATVSSGSAESANAEADAEAGSVPSGNPDVIRVIGHLNAKAGTNFAATAKVTTKLVEARLKDGATADQCIAVIDNRVKEWLHDDKMRAYLRPATLFNAEKFESYRGGLVASRATAACTNCGHPQTAHEGSRCSEPGPAGACPCSRFRVEARA